MADDDAERAHEASPRRLERARADGDRPRSPDAPGLAALAAGALALGILGPEALRGAGAMLAAHLARLEDPGAAAPLLLAAVLGLAGLALAAALASVLGGFATGLPGFGGKAAAPAAKHLSPASNLKKLFGPEALAGHGLALLKAGLVALAVVLAARGRLPELAALGARDAEGFAAGLCDLALALAVPAVLALAALAALDAGRLRFNWLRRLRMTRQEVKDEAKEGEGAPEVKARFASLRAARARRRLAAAVPRATLVVTNPTHYAVALRWEPGMPAPVCVAKGVDDAALRIRALARAAGVPVVEQPPLARALHASVPVDGEIPAEHYKAVAVLVGSILRLARPRG